MATNIIMPALGMAQESGTLVRWLQPAGAHVAAGAAIAEIMTDKATVELESPATGVLSGIAAQDGDEVPVGQVIAYVLAAGEALDGATDAGPQHAPAPEARVPVQVPASPKARRLAGERGRDLATIVGTGPFGAVLAADVLALSHTPVAALASAPAAPAPQDTADGSALGAIWRIMAERTTQSWTHTPHFFLLREVNASRLVAWRAQARRQSATPVTYTDLLVKLVGVALRQHPRLNSSWHDGSVVPHAAVNIGLAVAVDDGLVVPVIHAADTLSLAEIAVRRSDLVARAQDGKLRPADLADGTFTISNLGMYGVDAFNAIIVAPQAAILAVGRIAERVVPLQGVPAVQPMLGLSLSCDHRVVDGARGAQFLSALADLIEEPLALLG
jgi:pyruvate dehydrogenase E2 component (dihydrolipoamide acetyltransferase)